MSVVDPNASDCARNPGACDPPGGEFDRAYDDPDDPSTLTFYPVDVDEADIETTWLSADLDVVVTMDSVR